MTAADRLRQYAAENREIADRFMVGGHSELAKVYRGIAAEYERAASSVPADRKFGGQPDGPAE
jgi:hypothetical protein